MKKGSGFSLIEIMVVLVIMGMIMAVIAPNIMGQQEEAKLDKARIDIQRLEDAMRLYKLQNNRYPTTEQGLEALVTETDIEPLPKRFPDGGYVDELPLDPWDMPYQLVSPGEIGKIDVFSMGPDQEAGTEDDIGNWDEDDQNR